MQSVSTCSRSRMSSRSWGSKRASCSSAAAPRSHGAMNTLRADFDQPEAAVHHDSRSARRREPVLGLHALAGEVALAVQHRLRLAAVPEVNVTRHGSSGSSSTGGHAGRRRSAPARARPGPQRPARPRRARRGCARRRRPAAAARSPAASAGPPRAAARCRAAQRRRAGSRRASPAPTRAGCRPASSRRPRGRPRGPPARPRPAPTPRPPRRSVHSARDPSRPARRAPARAGGAASTTSRAKFIEA